MGRGEYVPLRHRGDVLMGRHHYVPMGRPHEIPIRRREDIPLRRLRDVPETSLGVSFETCLRRREHVPLRRLGDVPLRRHWVFHLRRTCDVTGTYRETSLRRCYNVLLPGGMIHLLCNYFFL